jgi:hypothetical protein
MNWRLLFSLSLFGLAMGLITITLVPSMIEPLFWLIVFSICAYFIAKYAPGKYFLHGFVLSLMNSVWITSSHILFYNSYISHHADMADMASKTSMANHPRLLMALMGPLFGVLFGLIMGLFAFIASKLVRKA